MTVTVPGAPARTSRIPRYGVASTRRVSSGRTGKSVTELNCSFVSTRRTASPIPTKVARATCRSLCTPWAARPRTTTPESAPMELRGTSGRMPTRMTGGAIGTGAAAGAAGADAGLPERADGTVRHVAPRPMVTATVATRAAATDRGPFRGGARRGEGPRGGRRLDPGAVNPPALGYRRTSLAW